MKISCEIIQDILPLYAEDMVSNATKEMVDEHLCDCTDCSKELENLRKPHKLAAEVDVNSLKRVEHSIRRRRILAVMAVFLFVVTILVGGALLLDAKIYLPATEAVQDIYVEGEAVKIIWNDQITGTSSAMDMENTDNYAVTAWTSLHKRIFPKEPVPYEALSDEVKAIVTEEQYAMFDSSSTYSMADGMNGTNFWYYEPGQKNSMTLLLNAKQPFPEGPMMKNDPYCLYYVNGMAAMGVLCFLASILSKEKWYGELAGRFSVVLLSLALSVVVVTAGQFNGLEGHFREALIDSTVVALPMCLFGLCVRHLVKLNRQDKGL